MRCRAALWSAASGLCRTLSFAPSCRVVPCPQCVRVPCRNLPPAYRAPLAGAVPRRSRPMRPPLLGPPLWGGVQRGGQKLSVRLFGALSLTVSSMASENPLPGSAPLVASACRLQLFLRVPRFFPRAHWRALRRPVKASLAGNCGRQPSAQQAAGAGGDVS